MPLPFTATDSGQFSHQGHGQPSESAKAPAPLPHVRDSWDSVASDPDILRKCRSWLLMVLNIVGNVGLGSEWLLHLQVGGMSNGSNGRNTK